MRTCGSRWSQCWRRPPGLKSNSPEADSNTSPEYVARRGRPRSPEELPGHDYLRYAGSDDPLALSGFGRSVTVAVGSRYRVNSAVAMLEAVQRGAGVVLQPSWMVDALLRQRKLVRLLPRWTGPAQIVHLVYAPRRKQPMRVKAMADFLMVNVSTW